MRSRFMKMLAMLLAVCMLMCCLTGCEELSYREAVQLYNARQYERAADMFYELGDYQDSKALWNDSNYWIAMELMEAGDYASAWPRFHKLADYKDSADRAVECKYQMAIAAFEAEEYDTAEGYFLEAPEYRQAPEYLRQLNWQKLYDYILTGGEAADGVRQYVSNMLSVSFAAVDGQLIATAVWEKDMGYLFTDRLELTLTRDSTQAVFTARSGFTMTFGDGVIGTEQTGTGTVELASYTPGQSLTLEQYEMTGTDNLGQEISSLEPADSTMDSAMAGYMSTIWDCLMNLQAISGCGDIL